MSNLESNTKNLCSGCRADSDCQNFGTCSGSQCKCTSGFSGENCSDIVPIFEPKSFAGVFSSVCNTTDSCGNGNSCYTFPNVIKKSYSQCAVNDVLITKTLGKNINIAFVKNRKTTSLTASIISNNLALLTCEASVCSISKKLNGDIWNCLKAKCTKLQKQLSIENSFNEVINDFAQNLEKQKINIRDPLIKVICEGPGLSSKSRLTSDKEAHVKSRCRLNLGAINLNLSKCKFGECASSLVSLPKDKDEVDDFFQSGYRIAFVSFSSALVLVFITFLCYGIMQRYYMRRRRGEVKFSHGNYKFTNICYTLSGKDILNGISGNLAPGTLNAIIGPSGAGKSTLLEILAHVRSYGKITGSFEVGNKTLAHPDRSFRRCIGFVNQEDFLVPWVTVLESMQFAVDTRLPEYYSKKQKDAVIETILCQLNLLNVRNSRIGGNGAPRSLSGGEIRRLSIAIEIVTGPSIIFLDEPTSGLDSHNAYNLVANLRQLAISQKKIIMCSIHQPRPDIFSMFHTTTLIGEGRMLYGGPTEKLGEYFESRGYMCPQSISIADYALDVALGNDLMGLIIEDNNGTACSPKKRQEKSPSQQDAISVAVNGDKVLGQYNDNSEDTNGAAAQSSDSSVSNDSKVLMKNRAKTAVVYQTSCFTQSLCLLRRGFLSLVRDKQMLLGHILFSLFASIIVGTFYYRISSTYRGFQNRVTVVMFLEQLITFTSISAITNLSKDMAIFKHESSNGNYRPWLYVIVKIWADLVPLRLIPTIVFGILTYLMAGFVGTISKIILFSSVLSLFCVSSYFIAFIIGLLIRDVGVSAITYVMLMTFMSAFSGTYINLREMDSSKAWAQYFSIYRYATEAILVSETADHLFEYDETGGESFYFYGDFALQKYLGFSVNDVDLDVFLLVAINTFLFVVCIIFTRYKISDAR